MNVATILGEKGRDVVSVAPDVTLQDAATRLATGKIGAVLVLGADDRLMGILSERDIIRLVGEKGAVALQSPVSSAMTKNVVTCSDHDTVAGVMAIMTAGRFRHMPVVDGNRVAGIISIGDVVKNHIAEVEFEANALKNYLATG